MPAAAHAWFPKSLRLVSCAVLAAATFGCQSVSYYSQAVRGQYQLWSRQQPIEKLLADAGTPAELKQRLELVLEIRRFANDELLLPANGHYLKYADLQRRHVVWNVYAAPEFSLAPRSWWYPVVGSLDYRGYFNEAKARAHAARLHARGFDVYVGGVAAYSTLGWFHDPVLNTFLFDSDDALAELLFHELAHQRLFIAGDTEFNEAFATAVAEEGTRRWMKSRNNPAALAGYERQARRTEEFVSLVAGTRAELEALFGQATNRPAATIVPGELRLRKQRLLDELRDRYAGLRARWGGSPDYDAWFSHPLNNAQLNTVDTYYRLVPAFRAVLAMEKGDLEKFFRTIESMKRLKKEERRARLAGLAGDETPAVQAAAE